MEKIMSNTELSIDNLDEVSGGRCHGPHHKPSDPVFPVREPVKPGWNDPIPFPGGDPIFPGPVTFN
jgi:hypothetical protein